MSTPAQAGNLRPLTPKEFASDVLSGLRSPRWVCDRIKSGEIKAVYPRRPYLIDPSEVSRFRPSVWPVRA